MSKSKSKAQEALQFLDDLDFSVDDVPPNDDDDDKPESAAPDASAAAATSIGKKEAAMTAPSSSSNSNKSAELVDRQDDDDEPAADGQEAEDALKFLNDLTQKSTSARPLSRGPTASSSTAAASSGVAGARAGAPPPIVSASTLAPAPVPAATESKPSAAAAAAVNEPLNIPSSSSSAAPPASSSGSGWGSWSVPSSTSSLWSSATSALSAARSTASSLQREASSNLASSLGEVAAELRPTESVEGVKEDARKWGLGGLGRVKELVEKGREVAGGVDLEKLRHDLLQASQSGFTQLLATIAPPIAEHEVLSIVLSADLAGYDGVEQVVYRALGKILEQVEGGELVVRSAERREEVDRAAKEGKRDMFPVDGWEKAFELAESSIARLIEQETAKSSSSSASQQPAEPNPDLPVHSTAVYLRIQPVLHAPPYPSATPSGSKKPNAAASEAGGAADDGATKQLSFLLHLHDPSHGLTHTSQSQPIPAAWLAVPWETNGWVEERLVDALGVAVEVVGEAYVMERMGVVGGSSTGASGRATPRATGEAEAEPAKVE